MVPLNFNQRNLGFNKLLSLRFFQLGEANLQLNSKESILFGGCESGRSGSLGVSAVRLSPWMMTEGGLHSIEHEYQQLLHK